jgi:hypothetical protein
LSQPIISEQSGSVFVTFMAPSEQAHAKTISERIQELLQQASEGLAVRELEEQLADVDRRKIKYELTKLNEQGLAKTIGKGAATRWKIK